MRDGRKQREKCWLLEAIMLFCRCFIGGIENSRVYERQLDGIIWRCRRAVSSGGGR